jgi:hypothetical protein
VTTARAPSPLTIGYTLIQGADHRIRSDFLRAAAVQRPVDVFEGPPASP